MADLFARELVQAHSELEAMRERYQAAQARLNALTHENERLAALPRPWIPAVHVRCDTRGCTAVAAFDPAPEEARLAAALVALGWTSGARHYCPGCV
jgi:hypothetical protein